MDGKINNQGELFIMRAGEFKKQLCCYLEQSWPCGDHCPQLGEPVHVCHNGIKAWTVVDICQGRRLTFENFEDERSV